MNTATTTSTPNPFAFAVIAHKNGGSKRGRWYSHRDGLTTNRVFASCWPNKEGADDAATELNGLNPDYKFEARKFAK